jgi:hypothetical protein
VHVTVARLPRQVANVPLLAGDLPLADHRTTPVLLQE